MVSRLAFEDPHAERAGYGAARRQRHSQQLSDWRTVVGDFEGATGRGMNNLGQRQSQRRGNGGVEGRWGDAILIDGMSGGIGRSVELSAFDAAARQHGRKHGRVMVATGVVIDYRRTTELCCQYNECFLQQSAF